MPTENYNSLRTFFSAISFSSVLVKHQQHQKTTATSITGKKIGILVFYLRCQRMEKLHATKTIVPNVVNLHFALRLDCGAAVAAGCSLLLLVRYFLSKSTHMCVFFHCFSTLDAFNLMFFFLSLFFSVLISPILVFKKPSGPTEYETITEKKTRKSFSRVEKRKQKKREKEYCV